ncbi:hypothetical protein D9756_010428 [Leucocoprinus leucothites]|uniref:DUF803-domain-containing protein n=1 Tax=Leucocoprinus leucothites TaxID=201217 RepID=A0A8H5CRV4_9AGAR|nr:hypothetical protein D9756_010428 [Leucoagaricus leucothites]
MSSAAPSATSPAAAASSSAVSSSLQASSNLKVVGIILAIVSGLLIGSSFVFKKKGLLRSQAGGELGEGVAYLKSPLWWLGMIMMIIGELCNFAAYAFVEAIVVTPLGALSVVICAILSSLFLNEKLSVFGWMGCVLCILGSTIIALNGPKEESIGQIREFQKLFLAPGFLAYAGTLFAISLVIIFYFAPKYGKKNMLWYIAVCSMIGGISVSVTTGLGAAIVTTARGDNQFRYWFIYFLAAFVIATLITEVYYLNVALALFNTAMVTPTYYVIFTFCSMVTTVVLFQGLHASVTQILTLVLAFLTICVGITILQMSKIDPVQLSSNIKLDRRSTILLQAARSQTESIDEKHLSGIEDPGMDALRGSFGTFGSIIRAKSVRRMSQRSSGRFGSGLPPGAMAPFTAGSGIPHDEGSFGVGGLKRHQLYDAPMPHRDDADGGSIRAASIHSQQQQQLVNKRPTIKFDSQDVVHSYNRPGTGDSKAIHEHRAAVGSPGPGPTPTLSQTPTSTPTVYPPIPPPKSPLGPTGGTNLQNSQSILLQQQQQQRQQQQLQQLQKLRQVQSASASPREGKLLEIESPEEDTPATNLAVLGDNDSSFRVSGFESTGSTSALLFPATPGQNSGKDVLIPSHLQSESQIQSAPPTVYARFRSPPLPGVPSPTKRKDSRDVFNNTNTLTTTTVPSPKPEELGLRASGMTTLLSFPSVTDSEGRSEEVWDEEEVERQRERAREADRGRAQSKGAGAKKSSNHARKYPKGPDGDDDREESVSLFRRGAGTMSDEDVTSPSAEGTDELGHELPLSLPEGGIRLVPSGKGGVS